MGNYQFHPLEEVAWQFLHHRLELDQGLECLELDYLDLDYPELDYLDLGYPEH